MIEMTPVAAEKLRELRGTDPSRAFLRMYVAGKSCCSYQFGLAFDATPDEKDTVSDVAGIPLAVDPVSQPYADGAIIDFVDGPEGSGFLVRNPTLGGGCACGGGRDARELRLEHEIGDVGVLEREGTAETAADRRVRHLGDVDARDAAKQLARLVVKPEHVRGLAGVVIRRADRQRPARRPAL